MHIDPLIVVFGLGVGVLVGMTGIGGGSLMTPMLILVFGVQPVTAIGTDLAYGAVTKTLGGWRHWRQGTVDLSISTWMALGSVPAAVVGVVALKALQRGDKQSFDDIVLIAVAAALVLCGITMLARRLLSSSIDSERDHVDLTRRQKAAAVAFGLAIGFVLGVTSAGSGSLITVALILVFRITPRRVVGTDVFHAAILLWAAALAHLVAGDIDYGLAATILIGSLPGVWIGSALTSRVPVAALRTSLGLLLIGAGLALIQKAGAGVPTPLIAAFPLSVVTLLAAAQVRSRTQSRRGRQSPDAGERGQPTTLTSVP